jgi:hypothetical protein
MAKRSYATIVQNAPSYTMMMAMGFPLPSYPLLSQTASLLAILVAVFITAMTHCSITVTAFALNTCHS